MPFHLGKILVAGVAFTMLGVSGFGMNLPFTSTVDVRIEPKEITEVVDNTFTVDLVVESDQPVNVFAGEVQFDPGLLAIESIAYNTSIANLWAEKPWYANGEGTLNFAGGTTKPGGFTGAGTLLAITFITKAIGDGNLSLHDIRVLQHDGLGTDATVLAPIDTLFTINVDSLERDTVLQKSSAGSPVAVLATPPRTDLNGDGRQSLIDVSIFMRDIVIQNKRSDFNGDGTVGNADLSILLNAE
ncbi:hypothetical protein N9L26_02075 [Candidatus Pacebacteria bacterium]|nr:hypothetical protein [Candidatus Paceibacterota bacterium]